MPKITAVRNAIETVLCPAGYSKAGWAAIRRSARIPKGRHTCTPVQEKMLWAAASLRRSKPQNQGVEVLEVLRLVNQAKGDISKVVSGYLPVMPDPLLMPASVEGWELPGLVEQWTGYRPNDNRLRAWCEKLGFKYSRRGSYSANQTVSLIELWRSMRVAERDRSRKQAYQNFHAA